MTPTDPWWIQPLALFIGLAIIIGLGWLVDRMNL